jgi:hypothetical protein
MRRVSPGMFRAWLSLQDRQQTAVLRLGFGSNRERSGKDASSAAPSHRIVPRTQSALEGFELRKD